MADNEIYSTLHSVSVPVPADTPAGVPVRIGSLNGFTEGAEGGLVGTVEGYATVNFDGAFKVDVAGALTKGQAVYITSANALTATATGNFPFGVSLSDKGTGTGPAVIAVAKFGVVTAASA